MLQYLHPSLSVAAMAEHPDSDDSASGVSPQSVGSPIPRVSDVYKTDFLRLEAVTCCVGFDDFLDATLGANMPHVDTMIVVTSHEDKGTQNVARKHGAVCVQTDLFRKNGRNFNKGAAINAGLARFQYHGWRLHLDADIALPSNFRRLLFNHTHLDPACIYGADRANIGSRKELAAFLASQQHSWSYFLEHPWGPLCARYLDPLRGYVPIGFFQLWSAQSSHSYPYSLGTAAHDDVMFAEQWSSGHRRLLPSAIVGHCVAAPPKLGENWDGKRGQPLFR